MPSRFDQLAQHEQRIVGQAGVVEAAREMLGLAAVALIETYNIPARGKGLVGHAAHVVRSARALEAVQEQQRRMARGLGMPVTMREHTCVGRDVEETRRQAMAVAERSAALPTRRSSGRGRSRRAAGTRRLRRSHWEARS